MYILDIFSYAFLPLAIYVVLRFYFFTKTFSVYEYMEKRFNTTLRVLGSMSFIILKAVYCGSIFFAASKIFSSLVGWHPLFTILVVGIFTVIYSAIGGMKAVMLTDLVQGFMILLGVGAIAFVLLKAVNFDLIEVYRYAESQAHGMSFVAEKKFWEFNLHNRLSAWMFLWAWVLPIGILARDQSTIQRLLASKGLKPAKKAIYGNMAIAVPIGLVLWFIGLGLSYFYSKGFGQRFPNRCQRFNTLTLTLTNRIK